MKTEKEKKLTEVPDLTEYRNKKLENKRKPMHVSLIFLSFLLLGLVSLGIWCKTAKLEESVPGMGQFAPEMKVRKVTSPSDGIVSKVYVQEDQKVKKGQVLAILDSEYTETEQSGILNQVGILQEEISSINDAYTNNKSHHYSKMKQAWVNAAQQTLQARMNSVDEEIKKSEYNLKQAVERKNKTDKILQTGEEILAKYKKLYNSGGIALNEVKEYEQQVVNQKGESLALEQEVNAQRANLKKSLEMPNEVQSSYQKDLLDRVSDYRRAAAELQTQVQKSSINLKHEKIISPIDGIINEQTIRGSGETVRAGDILLSLVPDSSKVVAEIKVTNRDLAYIHEGQEVILKVEALPYQKFGKLKGKVESISPSTISDKEGKPFYVVRVKPKKYNLTNNDGLKHSLKSGMTVSADFITRKRNIFEFIAEPVEYQLDKAFRDPSTR